MIHLTVQPLRKVGEPTMSFDAFKSQVRDLLQTRCNYTIQEVEELMIADSIELQEAWEGGWDPSTTTTGIQLGW